MLELSCQELRQRKLTPARKVAINTRNSAKYEIFPCGDIISIINMTNYFDFKDKEGTML